MQKIFVMLLAALALVACQARDSDSGRSGQTGRIAPEMRQEYDAALQAMLDRPGDLDAAFKYAAIAKKAGDLEGAIGTYEGLLLVESDLPKVRVELGMLYYQLKSYPVARSHLEAALQSPKMPADLRKPAEAMLTKMPKQAAPRAPQA